MMSFIGPGRRRILNGMMNTEQFKNLCKTLLIPQLQDWFSGFPRIVMHDGTRCQTANVIKDFFEDLGLKVLSGQGNSPDMNPMAGIRQFKGKN